MDDQDKFGQLFDPFADDGADDVLDLKATESEPMRFFEQTATFQTKMLTQAETFRNAVGDRPLSDGESIHVISAANVWLWAWVPIFLDWFGVVEDFHCATWRVSREIVLEMFRLHDAGKIKRLFFLCSASLRTINPAIYEMLREGMRRRGQKLHVCNNHAKALCLRTREHHLTVVSSANLNGNPRFENYVATAGAELYAFYREWMEGLHTRRIKTPKFWSSKKLIRQRRTRQGKTFAEAKRICPDDFLYGDDGLYDWTPERSVEAWDFANADFHHAIAIGRYSTVFLMIGPPASGKSTWVDDNQEAGGIYFDATFTTAKQREPVITLAKNAGLRVVAVHFNVPVDVCLRRNERRTPDRMIPEDKVREMFAALEAPTKKEGIDEVILTHREHKQRGRRQRPN